VVEDAVRARDAALRRHALLPSKLFVAAT
jgi:hypothetical protein